MQVIIVMGATGTGKSKLAIDLAVHFDGEIINSDKIQIHKGLDIITNKVTSNERRGIPHHLIGIVDMDEDFTTIDFCRHVIVTIESITKKEKVPIIAGGSNSFIDELVNDSRFKGKYQVLFLWIDVSLRVLEKYVFDRVDQMVEMGAVKEARGIFDPESDYSRGIRKAIGVPEFDRLFRAERNNDADEETLALLLKEAVDQVKWNTLELARKQRDKIQAMREARGWELHKIDATEGLRRIGRALCFDRV